jgi:type IV pilus assembly protein PilC
VRVMLYKYIALDKNGRKIKGKKEANSQDELRIFLSREGKILLEASENKGKILSFSINKIFSRIKSKDLIMFTRELATMVDAGINLRNSITIIREQTKNKDLKKVLRDIEEELDSGKSFSESVKKYPRYFNEMYVSMIKVGENTGTLPQILEKVATALEKKDEIKGKIKSIMIYPSVVLLTSITIIILMLVFIIPKFSIIFQGQGVELPKLTKLVISLSNTISRYGYIIFIGIILVILGLKNLTLREDGKRLLHGFILKLPIIGNFTKKVEIVRFTRTLEILLSSGIPVLKAFDITYENIVNRVIKDAIIRAKESIRSGETIYKPIMESKVFPSMVTDMIKVGEESGKLVEVLGKLADFNERELDESVRDSLAILEPLVIVLISIGIGILIIAMFLPLYKVSDIIN